MSTPKSQNFVPGKSAPVISAEDKYVSLGSDNIGLSADSVSPLLTFEQVTKTFKKEDGTIFKALKSINLNISKEQHLISLIGPDGAGKSTLLRIIAGLSPVDEGAFCLYLGSDTAIGYMSQNLGLYEDLSVGDNLRLFALLRDLSDDILRHQDTTLSSHHAGTESKASRNAVEAEMRAEAGAESGAGAEAVAEDETAQPRPLSPQQREELLEHYLDGLLTRVGLIKFKDYKAGSLSGGMKQKLALTCAISVQPKLLLLDEPTVGVDPISRIELWNIITDYLERSGSYCVFSSLYLEEAEKGEATIFIREGEIIFNGSCEVLRQEVAAQCFALNLKEPRLYQKIARALMCHLEQSNTLLDICPRLGRIDLLCRPGTTRESLQQDLDQLFTRITTEYPGLISPEQSYFDLEKRVPVLEDAYINLTLHRNDGPGHQYQLSGIDTESKTAYAHEVDADSPKLEVDETGKTVVINVSGIRKQFGNFTAVHDSNFKVYKGEIFGLLGPNGAGKTTTFRMICALLNPSAGTILINNMSLSHAKSSVRARIGYVAQKFCLYRKLTTQQNLTYFGKSYGLKGRHLQERIDTMVETFGLKPYLNDLSLNLPFGIQRSLSMACALIHGPDILFLDEATSGADPTSRRAFWSMMARLAHLGTTIIVTTHFMEEAEYCDRFLIQDQGKILILGTPDEICASGAHRISIEEAFISCVKSGRQQTRTKTQ